jgi:hypothetical protein
MVIMNGDILTASESSTSGIAVFREWLLRIHGTVLILVALGNAVATTIGWMTGTGLFGFMQQNPMVWVGLIQAYKSSRNLRSRRRPSTRLTAVRNMTIQRKAVMSGMTEYC